MRRVLRLLATGIAAILAGMVLSPVAGEFFVEIARQQGLYDHPSERLDAAMNAFSSFVAQPWFLGLTVFFVGLAIGTWLDLLLGRRERRKRDDPLLARELLRFIDVRSLPTIEWWYNKIVAAANQADNDKYLCGVTMTYIYVLAELDMQAARFWVDKARRIDEPLSAKDMQDMVCDLHSTMLRLYHLNNVYKAMYPPRWVVENILDNSEMMAKYMRDLDDLAYDSRCKRIASFLKSREKYI